MSDLTTVRCARYACNLAINTCVAKWKQSVNATPGVKGSACAGCEQGRERMGQVQLVGGGEGDLTRINEGSKAATLATYSNVGKGKTMKTVKKSAATTPAEMITCPHCGKEFQRKPGCRTKQVYCCKSCAQRAWEAKNRSAAVRKEKKAKAEAAEKISSSSGVQPHPRVPNLAEIHQAKAKAADEMASRITELTAENEGLQKQVQELMGDREMVASELVEKETITLHFPSGVGKSEPERLLKLMTNTVQHSPAQGHSDTTLHRDLQHFTRVRAVESKEDEG